MTESVALAVAGGLLGLLVTMWGIDLLPSVLEARVPRADGIRIDATVLAFSMCATLLTGLLFGLAPALQTANGAVGIAQGKRAGHDGQQPRAPLAQRHRRHRNRAGGGGAGGRRAPRSQLPHADGAGRRVHASESRLVQRAVPLAARRRLARAGGGAADGSARGTARRRGGRGGDRFPDGHAAARPYGLRSKGAR